MLKISVVWEPSPAGEGGPLAVDEVTIVFQSREGTEPQRDGGPSEMVDEVLQVEFASIFAVWKTFFKISEKISSSIP